MPPKHEIINWYEKIPSKFIVKSHNPHIKIHNIKLPFRMLICGSSGSGKTNTLLNLMHIMPDTFEHIYIVVKCSDEPLYNFLKEKLEKVSFKITEGVESLPVLDKLDKESQTLIIMDDLVGEKNQSQMTDYFLRARKKNASLVYITQSYYQVPKMIRNNLTYLIIKQISSMRNLAMIAREYETGMDKNELISIYKQATKSKFDFLMIDLEGDDDKKFRRNFDEYYCIPDDSDDEGGEGIKLEKL